ncbi:MAG: CDGSH iron-sulfur domain-containing protein [Planctomycetes bacterium]|nr:CDGSH iron-sulfur domain-containing protein [Planctomycetota bacterium]
MSHSLKYEVKAGETKAFCMCGKTANFPLCDGSHVGTGKKPFIETFTDDKIVSICRCSRSQKLPRCDGSHRQPLPAGEGSAV